MADRVNQQYLDAEVTAKGSEAHLVYVSAEDDTFLATLLPTIESAAAQVGGGIPVVLVHIDTEIGFCEKFQVLMVPTIFVFDKGKLRGSISGYIPEADLVRNIDEMTQRGQAASAATRLQEVREALQAGASVEDVKAMLEVLE